MTLRNPGLNAERVQASSLLIALCCVIAQKIWKLNIFRQIILKNGVPLVFGFQPIKFKSYYGIYFRSVKNICVKITKRRLIIIQYCDLFEYESKCSLSKSCVTQELLFQILPFRINQTDHECILNTLDYVYDMEIYLKAGLV